MKHLLNYSQTKWVLTFANLASLLLIPPSSGAAEKFSIYCTSNFDYTGDCSSQSGESLECLTVPGGIIACRDDQLQVFECVQYGAIFNYQSEFQCEPDSDSSINTNLFKRKTIKSTKIQPDIKDSSSVDPGQGNQNSPEQPTDSPSGQAEASNNQPSSSLQGFKDVLSDSEFKGQDESNQFRDAFK